MYQYNDQYNNIYDLINALYKDIYNIEQTIQKQNDSLVEQIERMSQIEDRIKCITIYI